MTTNYRMRHTPLHNAIRNSQRRKRWWRQDTMLPYIREQELLRMKHGDVFYRGRIHHDGIHIEEHRVLDRPRPLSAYAKRSTYMRKDYEDRISVCYHLHARKMGARPHHEKQDYPMTREARVKLARDDSTLPLSKPKFVSAVTGYIKVKREGYTNVPQYKRGGKHIEVTFDDNYRTTPRSITEYLRLRDDWMDKSKPYVYQTGDIHFIGDLHSYRGFATRSKTAAIRIAREFLQSNYANAVLLELHMEEESERALDASRGYDDWYDEPLHGDDGPTEDEVQMTSYYDSPEEPLDLDPILNDPIFDAPATTSHLTDQQVRALGVEE